MCIEPCPCTARTPYSPCRAEQRTGRGGQGRGKLEKWKAEESWVMDETGKGGWESSSVSSSTILHHYYNPILKASENLSC